MSNCLLEQRTQDSITLIPVSEHTFESWLSHQDETLRRWISANGFKAKPHSICPIPDNEGHLRSVIVGITTPEDPWACAGLPSALPEGNYHLEVDWPAITLERIAVGWGLGGYRFTRYREAKQNPARLALPPNCDQHRVYTQVQALTLVRDLINTPAEDMMPEHLAETMVALGSEFNAQTSQIVGAELLAENFPVIHAVGRASIHPPRLLDLRWGRQSDPLLILVGKGVCFDSGGLDLKPSSNMRLMKKDMGGAAHVLGLARMVMASKLPVRLRVLIPTVENAVAGNAFRPGDVLRSRQGLTIEIDNTDAEGRLILCDALTEGLADKPDLLIDFATLTGAARVALGTEVPALFCNHDEVASALMVAAKEEQDPIWRLPLHKPYRELLDSKIADIANSASTPYGGAITAALFLQEFVPSEIPWAHFDIMAWNTKSRPGRPEGGEAMGLRAVFRYLEQRFGK